MGECGRRLILSSNFRSLDSYSTPEDERLSEGSSDPHPRGEVVFRQETPEDERLSEGSSEPRLQGEVIFRQETPEDGRLSEDCAQSPVPGAM